MKKFCKYLVLAFGMFWSCFGFAALLINQSRIDWDVSNTAAAILFAVLFVASLVTGLGWLGEIIVGKISQRRTDRKLAKQIRWLR